MFILLLSVATVAALRGMWSPCGLSMLSSLNPVAERARGHRFWVTACWYVAGAASGGALLGAACALGARAVGALEIGRSTASWIVLFGALVALLSDTALLGWSLPMHPRQVDDRWLTKYRRWIYAGGYGVQIGTGFATYIMTAAVYLMALLAALTGQPRQAFVAGVLFGVVRGLSIALAAPARDPDRLRAVAAWVDDRAAASAYLARVASAVVAVVAAARVGGPAVDALVVAAACAGAQGPWLSNRARTLLMRTGKDGSPSGDEAIRAAASSGVDVRGGICELGG